MERFTSQPNEIQIWDWIHKILILNGVSPRISGKFYKAVVQAILLYGSDTWVVDQKIINDLKGFNNGIYRIISNIGPKHNDNGNGYTLQ